ncbi:lysophosphatidic acid receptor 6-like [Gigantopelta aegis]|uniref:lysophosphatidic acid receptor 6-like n=1 Tax=Gigantopelta aegis TaxID=1735272 RepID=UPI001B88A1F3|nr:lysophosphatidic acid receptor 6-like [Gigantopelta aegis]
MADVSGNLSSTLTDDAVLHDNANNTPHTTHPDALVFWKTIPPVLICCGTIGNILTLVVLTQKSMRRSPMTSYLIILAVFDILALHTGLLRQWVIYYFDVDIRDSHVSVCKIHPVLVYFSLDMSAWILVCMTVERTVSVLQPHKVKVLFSSKTSRALISIVGVVLFAINGHFLYGNDITETLVNNGTVSKCTNQLIKQYFFFLKDVFPWIDLTMFCVLPLIVQVTGNILIITKLVSKTRKMNKTLTNVQVAENRKRQFSSMTIMLLTLNFMFLICTLPISVYLVFEGIWDSNKVDYKSNTTDLVYATTSSLMYANNTFNFVFYCLCGRRFRTELRNLFERKTSRSSFLETSFTISRSELNSSNYGNSNTAAFTMSVE